MKNITILVPQNDGSLKAVVKEIPDNIINSVVDFLNDKNNTCTESELEKFINK